MAIDDKIIDKKLQYDINREVEKDQHYHQIKLINTNMLQVKKYLLIRRVNKLSLRILY